MAAAGDAGVAPPVAIDDDGAFARRYRVEQLIGRGGMGEVRLCSDVVMGRDVALKTLRHDAGSADRFLREARIQGRLEHPVIVPVYDMGRADGAPWFTMKRVNGVTLAEVIAHLAEGDEATERGFGRRRLLTDFVQVCQAIAYAHDRGVIHRDLKPANVMLGEYGEVYVLDWGIAKTVGPDTMQSVGATASSDGATSHGAVLGTLGYMPPEQLAGPAVDERADIYALGAILFELLTCEPLHRRGDSMALATSTLDGADARASARAPAREVPPELEAICVRATALARDQRYGNVRELLAEVSRFLDGDRDQQRRREIASEHAALATALELRSDEDHDARARGLREAGRALTFAPDNREALTALGKLLTRPPRRMPPEVVRRLAHDDQVEGVRAARVGAVAACGWFVFLAIPLFMGLRDPISYAAVLALMVIIVAYSVRRAVRGASGDYDVLVIAVLQAIVLGLSSRLFGPFMMVPGLVVATTAMFALNEARWLGALVSLGCASLVVPWALERLGVLSPSFTIDGDQIVTYARMATFSPGLTEAALVIANVAVVAMAGLAIGRARTALNSLRRQLAVQAWQLEQIVPADGFTGSKRHLGPELHAGG